MNYFTTFLKNTKKLSALAVVSVFVLSVFYPLSAHAQVASINATPSAKISFTFDDGLDSAFTQAAPILAKYGLTGTDYVITGCVGMTQKGNTCHANTDAQYMTWDQISGLQNTYGWEIGSHTVTHPYLATSDARDGQPNTLTPDQVSQELTQSKADLAAHGFNATDFSTPYGDYSNATLAQIAKVYASHRGFADQNNNDWPYNDYLINDFQVEGQTSVSEVEAKIDDAIANNHWLVLTMHDILPNASKKAEDYQYSTQALDQIAAYVSSKQSAGLIKSVNVDQGLVTSDENLLPNSTFDNGIANGWTTDNPSAITADSGNNGSYPSPANSIRLTSGSSQSHLFSPKVSVDPNATYMLKNFLNVQSVSSGGIAFYIDEYNANGDWISGQYKVDESSAFVENMNFTYKPSSQKVAKASLQVIAYGSGVTAYLDNTQWFPLTAASPDPDPTPTPPPPPPPPPVQTNLISNGAFDNGISAGWSTDKPANITVDNSGNGSPNNLQNSIKLTSSTSGNGHLFSPVISVDASKQYSLTSYLDLRSITSGGGGEVAFYVDEYDTNGNWISGQYKLGDHTLGAQDVSFNYTPSSSSVKSASLQVIVVSNSNIVAYLDDIRWYQTN